MSKLSEYRQVKRAEARELKNFLPRTNGGFYSTMSGPSQFEPLIYLDGSQVMMMDQASVTPVTQEKARELIIGAYSSCIDEEDENDFESLIFTDRAAVRAFRKVAGNNTEDYGEENIYAAPVAAFDLLSVVKFSVTLKVLTDILIHRWWLPDGMNQNSIDSWVSSPVIKGAALPARLRSVEKMARSVDDSVLWTTSADFDRVKKTELSIFKATNYGGTASGFNRMRDMTTHKAHTTAIRRRSPGLQAELSLNGELTCAIVSTRLMAKNTSRYIVQGPTKLSIDKRVDVLDARGLRLGARNLVIDVSMANGQPTIDVNGSADKHLSEQDLVYMSESPFPGQFSHMVNKRWTGTDTYSGPTDRMMPPDVFSAGM